MKKTIKHVLGVILIKVIMNFLIIMHLAKDVYPKKEKNEKKIK